MAATNSTTNGTTKRYFQIIAGKFAEKATKETMGALSRQNKKNETVWEMHYQKINGKIENIVIETTDFGDQLRFGINDGFETCIVSIPCDSKFFRHFVQKVENVDFTKEVEIAPYSFEGKDGKQVTGLNIYQNGTKMPYAELKGLPKVAEGTVLDKDDYEIHKKQEVKFLKGYVKAKYLPTDKPVSNGQLPPNKGFEMENSEATKDMPF